MRAQPQQQPKAYPAGPRWTAPHPRATEVFTEHRVGWESAHSKAMGSKHWDAQSLHQPLARQPGLTHEQGAGVNQRPHAVQEVKDSELGRGAGTTYARQAPPSSRPRSSPLSCSGACSAPRLPREGGGSEPLSCAGQGGQAQQPPYRAGWPPCSAAPAPCGPARQPSCPVPPAAGAGLPGLQKPRPGKDREWGRRPDTGDTGAGSARAGRPPEANGTRPCCSHMTSAPQPSPGCTSPLSLKPEGGAYPP